jgi:hypothetical protein
VDTIAQLRCQVEVLTDGAQRQFSQLPEQNWARAISGFSWAESWGMWTDGDAALLLLRIDPQHASTITLRFVVMAFVHQSNPPLEVGVLINGARSEVWIFGHQHTEPHTRSVTVAADLLFDTGELWLHFTLRSPAAPSELGLTNDTRRLGLGFHSIEVSAGQN